MADRSPVEALGLVEAHGLIVDTPGDLHSARIGVTTLRALEPDEVLIDAKAAALNFPDLLMMQGRYQHKPPPPFVPGRDVAGIVMGRGSAVTDIAIGERIAAQPRHGAFATMVIAQRNCCSRLPASVSFETGAAAATILATVVGALTIRAELTAGQSVLVTGAAGGVGSAAIGYAKVLGARVVALVSSKDKERAVRAIGADIVLRSDLIGEDNMRDGLRAALMKAGLDGVNVVIDVVGGDVFEGAIRCVLPEGRYIVVGFASGRIPKIAVSYLLLKDIALIGSSLSRLFDSGNRTFRDHLDAAFQALADGRLSIPIDRVLPLSRFAEAAALMTERKAIGKLVFDLTAR